MFTASCHADDLLVNGASNDAAYPKHWRNVIGDICQLPAIARPTVDPFLYTECVYQPDNAGNRMDLGVWMLRHCPTGSHFVAVLRQCKTLQSIQAEEELCASSNASNNYEGCTQNNNISSLFVTRKLLYKPDCTCSLGDKDCECHPIEILELTSFSPLLSNAFSSQTENNQSNNQIRHNRQANYGMQPSINQNAAVNQGNSANCKCPETACVCLTVDVTNPQSQQIPATSNQQQPPHNPNQQQQPYLPSGCQMSLDGKIYCSQTRQPQSSSSSSTQAQLCPLANGMQNAQYQGICSWMSAALAADPQSPSHFLQCQPAPNNLYCGRWQRMPCEPGLIFNVAVQVCVWNPNETPGPIPPPAAVTQPSNQIPYVPGLPQYASSPYLPQNTPMQNRPQYTPSPYVQPIPVVHNRPSGGISFNSQCGCTNGIQIDICGPNLQCPGQSVCQNQAQQQCAVCCYQSQLKQ